MKIIIAWKHLNWQLVMLLRAPNWLNSPINLSAGNCPAESTRKWRGSWCIHFYLHKRLAMTNDFLRNATLQTLIPSATPPQKLTNFYLNKLFTHEIWASSFCAVDCSWMVKSWISLVSLNYLAFLRIIKLTYLACINALKFYARLLLTRNFWIAFFINQKNKRRLVKRGIEES